MSRKKFLKELDRIILQHRQQEHNDALDILLKTNNFSDLELKEQLISLILLGHQSLASALTSFSVLTTQFPEIISKMNAEQKNIKDLETSLLEKIKAMSYLEAVIKEVLRFSPPVPGSFRRVIKDCSFNGYRIPKNWYVIFSIKSVHFDREIYSQPELFNPERFNIENRAYKKQPYSYLPFGGGVRECLGKEIALVVMKIFGSTLLANYSWELLSDLDLELEARSSFIPTWQNAKINFIKTPR